MRGVVYREKMYWFFHLPVLAPTVNPAGPAGTTICLAVASGRNSQQYYIWIISSIVIARVPPKEQVNPPRIRVVIVTVNQ